MSGNHGQQATSARAIWRRCSSCRQLCRCCSSAPAPALTGVACCTHKQVTDVTFQQWTTTDRMQSTERPGSSSQLPSVGPAGSCTWVPDCWLLGWLCCCSACSAWHCALTAAIVARCLMCSVCSAISCCGVSSSATCHHIDSTGLTYVPALQSCQLTHVWMATVV